MTNADALAALVFAIIGLAGGVVSVLLGWLLFRIWRASIDRGETGAQCGEDGPVTQGNTVPSGQARSMSNTPAFPPKYPAPRPRE